MLLAPLVHLKLARLVVPARRWGEAEYLELAAHLQGMHLEHHLGRLRSVMRQLQHSVLLLQVLEALRLAPRLQHPRSVVRRQQLPQMSSGQVLVLHLVPLHRRQVLVALHPRLPLEPVRAHLECLLQRLLLEEVHLVVVLLEHRHQARHLGQHNLLRLSVAAAPLALQQVLLDLVLVQQAQVLARLHRARRLA